MDWQGQKLVVTGEEHAERMEAYTQLAAQVACRVQEALNMQVSPHGDGYFSLHFVQWRQGRDSIPCGTVLQSAA